MVAFTSRRELRSRPSAYQRKFLEILSERGPQDNTQSAGIRRITKRACQVRGWVEWRCVDGYPQLRAWHLTVVGRKMLESSRQLPRALSPMPVQKTPTISPGALRPDDSLVP